MPVNQEGLFVKSGQGSSYSMLGDLYTYKAVGEQTGQTYALCELVMQPQSGVPPHFHAHEDEAFYIQEGEMEFQLDERIIIATAGTFLHSPKGQVHQFKNIGSQPAKLLTWVTPAGFEKFVMEAGIPAINGEALPLTVSPEDIAKVMVTAPKYGITILPPPAESSQ